MADRPVVEVAFEEMFLEFTENCPSPLSTSSRRFLRQVFEATIEVLLEARQIEWDGRAERFSLSAAAALGREVHRRAGSGTVTKKHVEDSLEELLPYWVRICPLPPPLEDAMRGDCDLLRAFLRRKAAPSASKRQRVA